MQVGNRKTGNTKEKGWYKALVLVIGWLLIFSLARDVWQTRVGFRRIIEAKRRLEAEQAKNESLKAKLELVLTEEYKEKIIREKLNMQKEGEVLAVLPKTDKSKQVPGMVETETKEANWEKWWNLIK